MAQIDDLFKMMVAKAHPTCISHQGPSLFAHTWEMVKLEHRVLRSEDIANFIV